MTHNKKITLAYFRILLKPTVHKISFSQKKKYVTYQTDNELNKILETSVVKLIECHESNQRTPNA